MSEQDIDKLFRDNLGASEEPISDADWKQFEAMAVSKKSFKWAYLISGLLLLGASGYFMAPILSTSTQSGLVSSVSDSESQEQSKTDTPTNTSSSNHVGVTETENQNLENIATTSQSAEDSADLQAQIANNNNNSKESSSKSSTQGFGSIATNANASQKAGQPTISATQPNTNQERSNPSGIVSTASSSRTMATGSVALASNPESRGNSADPTSISGNFNTASYSEMRITNSVMEFSPEEMKEIGLSELGTGLAIGNLNADAPSTEIPSANQFSLDVFGQFELNNELGGIPSLGLMGNWNQNKWKMSLGLSLAKTGTLNWNQDREDIIYGFDRYSTEATLQTKNFTYLSMPLQVSRLLGGRTGAFVGLTPAMIINASQAYSTNENGVTESSGYLFETGAPSFMLFLSGGVQYYIREDIRLDLGINFSPQDWEVTSKQPLGGFIRLNYTIR